MQVCLAQVVVGGELRESMYYISYTVIKVSTAVDDLGKIYSENEKKCNHTIYQDHTKKCNVYT